jgi:ribosomal protein L40E
MGLLCLMPWPERAVMFQNALNTAIDGAHPRQIDHLSRQLWAAHAAGHIPDGVAQDLAELLHQRRQPAIEAQQGVLFPIPGSPTSTDRKRVWTAFPARVEQRSPDRQASIERRRRLAASGPLPPAMAARFTVSELAVLRIVGDEVLQHGVCDRSLAELAARAGCCRKLAQRVLRMASRDGLVTIERRPRPGRKNLTNVVRIMSGEWSAWLKRGQRSRQVQGEKIVTPRTQILERGFAKDWAAGNCAKPAGYDVTENIKGSLCR